LKKKQRDYVLRLSEVRDKRDQAYRNNGFQPSKRESRT
jgi:hypothetical protein